MNMTIIGLDIAKLVFHAACCNEHGKLAIRQLTAVCNQIRGLAAEYGICISRSVSSVRQNIMVCLSDECTELSVLFKQWLFQLKEHLNILDVSIGVFDDMINVTSKENAICLRLQSIPRVGPMIASAYFNEVGNGSAYRKDRE
jgi:transposase